MNVHTVSLCFRSLTSPDKQRSASYCRNPPCPTGVGWREEKGPRRSQWQNLRTAIPVVQLVGDLQYWSKVLQKMEKNKWLFLKVVVATSSLWTPSVLEIFKNQLFIDKTKCIWKQVEEAHLFSKMEQWMCSRITHTYQLWINPPKSSYNLNTETQTKQKNNNPDRVFATPSALLDTLDCILILTSPRGWPCE